MSATAIKKSTTVRNSLTLATLRAGFRVGSTLAPKATAHRAARMFSTPSSQTRLRAGQTDDEGARRSVLNVDGEQVAVYEWGDANAQPHVLLAHGWSSFALRFRPWLAPLRAAGYAVVGFDQVGHGFSSGQRSTLPQFVRNLRAVGCRYGRAAAVIGHSMGGGAAAIALTEGLLAERAVLIAPAADLRAALDRFGRFVRLPVRLCDRVSNVLEAETQIRFASLLMHPQVVRLSQPALIIHDLEDADVPWEEGERYVRYWPGARLLSTDGLGHHRILGDADVIAAALRFLGGECVGERIVSSPNLPYGYA